MIAAKLIVLALCLLCTSDVTNAQSPSGDGERYSGSSDGSRRGSYSGSKSSGKRSGSYSGSRSGKSASSGKRSGSYDGGSGKGSGSYNGGGSGSYNGGGSGSYNGGGGSGGGGSGEYDHGSDETAEKGSSSGDYDHAAPAPPPQTCCPKDAEWDSAMTGCSSLAVSDCESQDQCALVEGDSCPVSAHYVVRGREQDSWEGKDLVLCVEDTSAHTLTTSPKFDVNIAVSCCTLDGGGVRPDCEAHPKNFQEALAICEGEGYRLCTLEEMLHGEPVSSGGPGVTGGAGCSFDWAYNWASTPCDFAIDGTTAADTKMLSVGAAMAVTHSVGPFQMEDQDLIYVVAAGTMLTLVAMFYGCAGKKEKGDVYEELV